MTTRTRTVVITGATSGMGLSATRLFSRRGWQVVMADLNDEVGVRILAELGSEGLTGVSFHRTNVADAQSVADLKAFTDREVGTVDSIINNAGIFRPGMLHEIPESDWDLVMGVDVKSIYLMSREFIPSMIEAGGGTIVNTASISGLCGDYNMAVYNAAKGAVVNLMRAMALDYGRHGIRVNNVCPGATKTPMFQANPPEVIRQFEDASPLGRIATPEDIARVMYFLASEESDPINGENIPVSGGMEIYSGQPVQR